MSHHYEMLCIFPGTLAEAELPQAVSEVKDVVEQCGGSKLTVNDLGKSRLAYPIKHIRYGYFSLIRFEAAPEAIDAMNQKLRLMSGILRQVITKYNPSTAGEVPTSQETLNEIVRGGGKTDRRSRGKEDSAKKEAEKKEEPAAEEAPKTEEKEENQQTVEKTEEKTESVDKANEEQVPLDKIGDKLDEILEKSIDV